MAIHRGQILAYDSTNHKADVLLLGSMSGIVLSVPVADHVPPDAMVADTACGVMFFGEGDAGVVVCTFDGTPFNALKDLDFDAKGDLLVGKAADDYDRLAVGSNGQVLTADSGETLGVKWAEAVPGVPCCRVYNSAAILTGSGGWTFLTFDSERYDTDGIHSTVSNTGRLTAQEAGPYAIKAAVRWYSNNTGARSMQLRLNGVTGIAYCQIANAGVGADFKTIGTDYYLGVGEYVEVATAQWSGGNLNVEARGNYSPEFMMAKIG